MRETEEKPQAMPLTATSHVVDLAIRSDTAALAFNVITLEHAQAIAAACERTGLPAILAVSHNAVRYHGDDPAVIVAACAAVARRCRVPLSLHLDHIEDPELAFAAPDLGCTSVMFDASRLPHDENVRVTAEVTARLHARGVWVEAELGEIGGKDGVHAATARTDPAEAAAFVAATGVDALAVAVGSSHAMTTRTARLDQDLIARLRDAVDVPLVLHGSSGVPEAELREAVRNGMRKINFGTHLNTAFTAAVREALAATDRVDPRRYLAAGREAASEAAAAQLRLLAPASPAPAGPVEKGSPMPSAPTGPEPVADPRRVLTDAGERALEREGIPMFLALQSVEAQPAAEESVRAEGAGLASLLGHYRSALSPECADDAEPALIDVLQVMAVSHFTPQAPAAAQNTEEQR